MGRKLMGAMCLALIPGLATAASPDLFDPGYHSRSLSMQRKPPRVLLDPIISPAPGAPALVAWGGSLKVTLILPPGVSAKNSQGWQVWLSTHTQGPDGRPVGQPVQLRYACPVIGIEPGPSPDTAVLWVRVPALPPRETYHLELAGPGGLVGRRVHAVRLLGDSVAPTFSFAVLADHQLRDPSTPSGAGDLNNHTYPKLFESAAESMLAQQVTELSFLDPDFVLYLGDLVFGTDYSSEYPEVLKRWWARPLAAFMVPGNHDGMALYELALKQGWWLEAVKTVRCAKYVLEGDLTAQKVFSLLGCVYGDLKKMLFEDLAQDGLDYWRRYLGPTDFAFERGGYRFIGLNSYSGTPQRRHGFVLGLDFLGWNVGVATVDNYGGFMSDDQLSWLTGQLATARSAGQRAVVFLHHDPRGNQRSRWGERYHVNLPFPTEPLGLRRFQEWNYEGNPDWDSDLTDGRLAESQVDNSAVALLGLLARSADYVFTGHIHDDQDVLFEPGQELTPGSGILAKRAIHLSRVSTASSTPLSDKGYWGLRYIEAGEAGLDKIRYRPQWGWASMPSGNLWIVGEGVEAGCVIPGTPADLLYSVHNGLPQAVDGLLRAYLDAAPEGFRFSATGPGASVALADVGRGTGGRNIYYLKVHAPGVGRGQVPPKPGREPVTRVLAQRASGNRAPVVAFTRSVADPVPGQAITFDATGTRDPDGSELLVYIWEFSDGTTARGSRVTHAFDGVGSYTAGLTVLDDCGAYARYSEGFQVAMPPSCAFTGTACAVTGTGMTVFLLIGLIWWTWRRRLRIR